MEYGNAHGKPLMDRHLNNPLLSIWNKQDIPVDIRGEIDQDQLLKEIGLDLDSGLRPVKPNLEGTITFDRVWDTNSNFLDLIIQTQKMKMLARSKMSAAEYELLKMSAAEYELLKQKIKSESERDSGTDVTEMGGTARNAFHVLRAMQQAHPITVDPEQINVLPEWETVEECVDYATHVRLPFDCLFLDCELPTRSTRTAKLPLFGDQIQLLGGLAAIEDETLILIPFIRLLSRDNQEIFRYEDKRDHETSRDLIDITYFSWGAVTFNLNDDPAALRMDEIFNNSTMFRESESTTLGLDFKLWDMDFGWLGTQMEANDPDNVDGFKLDMDIDYPYDPSPCRLHLIPSAREHPASRIASLAAGLFKGASEMLKILYFLDTPNIEIVDAPVSRQVRRQAERSGAAIAKTVFVRHSAKRYPRHEDDGEHIEYSHQFEVRGHWKYYPEGTRTADARPDLLRYVPGRGMCRKIWCPPFVKGDPEKPLVIKTRRLRDDEH